MRTLLTAISFLVCLNPAAGASLSIEQPEQTCKSRNGQAACAAYLMGMVHGLQLATT